MPTSISEVISLIKGTVKVANDWMKGVDSNWGSFFQNSSYIQWGKKGRGWKYFDTNTYCSSLITYVLQLKATLEYTGLQLTPTEMQKSDN